ncbi:MAG TPA: polymer-forming cytoskeletal protein [Bacillota bacterium]|nr:polymer-forming cytoskeletal protein [Bacillota bacterium]
MVGSQTEFQGKVAGSGSIRIDGRLQGEVDVEGDAYVGQDGVVIADVRARDIVIAGEVRGNVHAAGRLELLPTSRLFGDIHAVRLAIADGAMFRGNCQAYTEDTESGEAVVEVPRRSSGRAEASASAPQPREAALAPARGLGLARSAVQAEVVEALDVRATQVAVGGATAASALREPVLGGVHPFS